MESRAVDRREVLRLLGLPPLAHALRALGLDTDATLAAQANAPDVEIALTAAPAEVQILVLILAILYW